jgi:hypothetical protein
MVEADHYTELDEVVMVMSIITYDEVVCIKQPNTLLQRYLQLRRLCDGAADMVGPTQRRRHGSCTFHKFLSDRFIQANLISNATNANDTGNFL